jgi:hypothetical protein
MEDVLLCLLLNNLHLLSLKQKKFILTQFVTLKCLLHVSACILAIVRHANTKTIQRNKQVAHMYK